MSVVCTLDSFKARPVNNKVLPSSAWLNYNAKKGVILMKNTTDIEMYDFLFKEC